MKAERLHFTCIWVVLVLIFMHPTYISTRVSTVWLYMKYCFVFVCPLHRWVGVRWMKRSSFPAVSSSCSSLSIWEMAGAGRQSRWGGLSILILMSSLELCFKGSLILVQGSEEGYLRKTVLRSVVADCCDAQKQKEAASVSPIFAHPIQELQQQERTQVKLEQRFIFQLSLQ